MTKVYCMIICSVFGILIIGNLVMFLPLREYGQIIFMKSATIMTRNSVSDHPENIYEMRKLNEGLNTSRRSHIQGEGQGMAKKLDKNLARYLYNHTRVLCWILTCSKNLQTRAKFVRKTWVKRCQKWIFVSDENNASFPTIGFGTKKGREHLTVKTMKAFDYIYKHHINDADWFLKADDDTYVIVENLRHLLSEYSPSEPIYFGYPFKVLVKQGYFSGGAGYVLSRAALERFGKRDRKLFTDDGFAEDLNLGKCLEYLNVSLGDSRDRFGRSRFHCFSIEATLSRKYMGWYSVYSKYDPYKTNISDYPISFHYVRPQSMLFLEYYVYHLKAYDVAQPLVD